MKEQQKEDEIMVAPAVSKEYLKVRENYLNYLHVYRKLNHGSLVGAVTFDVFYLYKTYVMRYADSRQTQAHSYK